MRDSFLTSATPFVLVVASIADTFPLRASDWQVESTRSVCDTGYGVSGSRPNNLKVRSQTSSSWRFARGVMRFRLVPEGNKGMTR